ncbi:MAG: hypothetical protein ACREL5_00300 [Gemmatimonadales bacterium]
MLEQPIVKAKATEPQKQTTSDAAVDSTWAAQPASGDWNTAANWSGGSVPTGSASFGASSQTAIVFSDPSGPSVGNLAFTAGAPSYTFTFTATSPALPTLAITGTGVNNDSTNIQHFIVTASSDSYTTAQLTFNNAANAGGDSVAYSVGPSTPLAKGGGAICFNDTSTAGSALFVIRTGSQTIAKGAKLLVGGEVSFNNSSSASTARFTIYGTTGTDGDTFGNAVFRDTATAANAVFTNIGGTVDKGDGGNTEFYDSATGAQGLYYNFGATIAGGNGGDVAFNGTSTAGKGKYQNYAAPVAAGNGGVTSFNNNYIPAPLPVNEGASAGNGLFINYGADASDQGGGHTSFSAITGSPTAANGTFVNYGSAVPATEPVKGQFLPSVYGHTIFSVSLKDRTTLYSPNAGSGIFWNLPGTVADAPGGATEFTVYPIVDGGPTDAVNAPTAGTATCINLGAVVPGAWGGKTSFGGTSSAANAQLIAAGGFLGGGGGTVAFEDMATGGSATIRLQGNGTLDVSYSNQSTLTIGELDLSGGCIATSLGKYLTCVAVSGNLSVSAGPVTFAFTGGDGFDPTATYTILTAAGLANCNLAQFAGNAVNGASPTFAIVGTSLTVSFGATAATHH